MEPITEPKQDLSQRNSDNNPAIPDRFSHIPGWGMDADPENDPTYPMKHWNGADHQRLNYERAPQQPVDIEVFRSVERPTITRVFGTSTPPRGLSGAIRRLAYKYSEATLSHWMTLILADRVDVIEGLVSDLGKGVLPNYWIEKGWRAEWKTNRKAVVQKIAAGVLASAVMCVIVMKARKRRVA
jgi:hypothetical protein